VEPELPALPVVPAVPVVVPPVQAPFVQLWPAEHACPQLPQFAVLVMVSTQPAPHSIWPATAQPHAPALHAAPSGHITPQPPQLSGSFPFVATHAPLPHMVVPVAQLEPHAPALQTWPVWQAFVQPPQWLLSGETQAPPQLSRPAWHWHDPP